MLQFLFAAALTASPPAECKLHLAAGEALIERRSLKTGNGTLEALSVREPDADSGAPSTRAMVLGPDCKVMFEQRFPLATQARFSEGRLARQPFLFVTTFSPGGSGCGYDHLILAYGGKMSAEDGVQPLAPMPLGNDNMGGIFVGDLGRGRGPGLILWSAQWEDGTHYSPHRYEIVAYRWRDGRFVGPKISTTGRKYDPAPNVVARRLGFRDMTQQDRFGGC